MEREKYLFISGFCAENENCSVACFNSIEKTVFLSKVYEKLGLKYKDADLNLKCGLCTAHYVNSWIVDPNGLLYKCWVDVGQKDRAVGDLYKGVTNLSLFVNILLVQINFLMKGVWNVNCYLFVTVGVVDTDSGMIIKQRINAL